jgi:hypothetical protein
MTLMRVVNTQKKIDSMQYDKYREDKLEYRQRQKEFEQNIKEMRRDSSMIYLNQ